MTANKQSFKFLKRLGYTAVQCSAMQEAVGDDLNDVVNASEANRPMVARQLFDKTYARTESDKAVVDEEPTDSDT